MKVKLLSRSDLEWSGAADGSGAGAAPHRVSHNPDVSLHPFQRAREERRALNAAKLGRVFAKPFVFALDGHVDGVYCLARSRSALSELSSGSADGSVRRWNLALRSSAQVIERAHAAFVRGISYTSDSRRLLSCGDDRAIRSWSLLEDGDNGSERLTEYFGAHAYSAVDASWRDASFAAAAGAVELWDEQRSSPTHTFRWGVDSMHAVRFNPVETSLLGACGADRSVVLYDTRAAGAVRKLVLRLRSNSLRWNPMEAFNFYVASDDHNVYEFDLRRLGAGARTVHRGHVGAVLDVDVSPTGRELVSASYDRTLRIFTVGSGGGGNSREMYHTRRMQRVFCAAFSGDADFVLSGSDDGDVRVWKAHPSAPLKPLLPRERDRMNYSERLLQRFQHVPEVRRIARHRHVPRYLRNETANKRAAEHSRARKELNRRNHTHEHSQPPRIPLRQRALVRELE